MTGRRRRVVVGFDCTATARSNMHGAVGAGMAPSAPASGTVRAAAVQRASPTGDGDARPGPAGRPYSFNLLPHWCSAAQTGERVGRPRLFRDGVT
jgi:hypothetical protein